MLASVEPAVVAAAVVSGAPLAVAGVAVARLRSRLARLRQALTVAQHAATNDRLTRVLNRAGLADAWPTLAGAATAVVIVDLNGFKPINDEHGHAAGDQVLTVVAARLARVAPGVVARLGGDEFAAVLTCSDPYRVAEVMAAVVAAPVDLEAGVTATVTASVGVAAPTGTNLPTALACADAAMYRAKAGGKAVAVYHPRLDDRTSPAVDPRPGVRVRDLPTQRTAWQVAA